MKINLLPEEEAVKSLDKQEIIKKMVSGALCVIAFVALLNLYFTLSLKIRSAQLRDLEQKYQEYISLEKQARALLKKTNDLERESTILDKFFPQHDFWSENLSELARLTPQEIWINKLTVDTQNKKEVLKIQGTLFTLQTDERLISVLNRFIKALRNDRELFKNFLDIILVDVKTTTTQGKEVLKFNLELPVK